MRPFLDRVTRQFVPVCLLCVSMCQAADDPVPNELNSAVDEPLANFPEMDSTSPFRSVSRPRRLMSSSHQDALIQRAEDAVDSARRRLLSTDINTPWQMMHGLLALRQNYQVRHNGKTISGLDWVSSGPSFENEPWFEKTQYGGRAHPYSRPWAFEGHANQCLAVLSMSALPLSYQFMTPNGPITIGDMVEHAQKTINLKDEPTWTLWALSRYLPPNATWRDASGENWSIERLVEIQTSRPLQGAACGGTHGMFALAHARNVYLRTGQPLRGVWIEAEYKIRRQISTARVQQNSNGMLSSNYFRGREYHRDFNKRMASAGHILEFLMIALPQDEIQERWVRRAIEATARDLLNNRKAEAKCSPLYHAVNGLNIYLDRMKLQQPPEVASSSDPDPKLRRLKNKDAGILKSVPATNISSAKPLTITAPVAGEEPHLPTQEPDSVRDLSAAARTTAIAPVPKSDQTPDSPAAVSSPANPSTSVDASVNSETGWKKSSKDDTSAPTPVGPTDELPKADNEQSPSSEPDAETPTEEPDRTDPSEDPADAEDE